MFIYFPEFLYKRTKSYIENTFHKPLEKERISNSLENIFSKALVESKTIKKVILEKEKDSLEMFSDNLNKIIKQKIALPIIELNHCNNFYDYFSEINPISYYNFTENKISICINKIKSLDLKDSEEQKKDKAILLFEASFLKEFSYFYDYNTSYSNKSLNLNDKAKVSIKGCRFDVKHKIKNKKFYGEYYDGKLEDELVKRCSYNDFKYRYFDDLEFESSKNEESINNLVKKYIDSNFF